MDALADALRRTLDRGALSGLPPIAAYSSRTLTPELAARIILADIEHVRAWERMHGLDPTSDERRQELANMIRDLLALQANPPKDVPGMSANGDRGSTPGITPP